MADLKPVSPGQPIALSAGDFNAMLDAARAHRARQKLTADEPAAKLQSGIILVKNASGSDGSFLDILAIDVPLILPTDSLNQWRSRVAMSCVSPGSTHAGRYVVLQEPIPAGKMGRAMVIGVTPVNLDVTADTDRFAEVATGVSTSLKTGTTGSARILWKESGTGAKRGVVMLTGEATSSAPHVDTVDPTVTDDDAAGFAVGAVWINESSDRFFVATDVTTGAAVWATGEDKPTEDGTVRCSKSDLSGGEWVMTIDLGRNAVGKAGKIQILSPNASGVAIEMDAALVTASSKKLTIREIDVCDAGVAKKMLVLGSATY
jgi:hypothetical protein